MYQSRWCGDFLCVYTSMKIHSKGGSKFILYLFFYLVNGRGGKTPEMAKKRFCAGEVTQSKVKGRKVSIKRHRKGSKRKEKWGPVQHRTLVKCIWNLVNLIRLFLPLFSSSFSCLILSVPKTIAISNTYQRFKKWNEFYLFSTFTLVYVDVVTLSLSQTIYYKGTTNQHSSFCR